MVVDRREGKDQNVTSSTGERQPHIRGPTIWFCRGGQILDSIGAKLRKIRQQVHLSLREVEERSLRLAWEWGSPSYQVSASWLVRLEREEHELTVNKLKSLANIYGMRSEQLLQCIDLENVQAPTLKQLSTPNATLLLDEGPLGAQAKFLLPDRPLPAPPDETTLLRAENGQSFAPHLRGIIGKQDRTLDPMVPAGSIVYIDTRNRAIASQKDWKHEFQRPIYFLMTREAYICGWCELDETSNWLTLVPHPLSPNSSRRWRYRTEIESIGRVLVAAMPLMQPI
jgi:transcriptional regulator with XRE-family HTH domain